MHITSANATCKLIGYTTVLSLINFFIPTRLYDSPIPLLWSVVCLTIVGVLADTLIVPRLGAFWSLIIGLPGMLLILMLVAYFSPTAHVTWVRALIISVCIAPLEYALHRAVLSSKLHP